MRAGFLPGKHQPDHHAGDPLPPTLCGADSSCSFPAITWRPVQPADQCGSPSSCSAFKNCALVLHTRYAERVPVLLGDRSWFASLVFFQPRIDRQCALCRNTAANISGVACFCAEDAGMPSGMASRLGYFQHRFHAPALRMAVSLAQQQRLHRIISCVLFAHFDMYINVRIFRPDMPFHTPWVLENGF